MAEAPKVSWPGASGKAYNYFVHDLSWNPRRGQDGNYIFARQIPSGWEAVYVGQGDLRDRKDAAISDGCVTEKGATHFHCHLNADEQSRLAEEEDVLEGNTEAYTPTGCNEKRGG